MGLLPSKACKWSKWGGRGLVEDEFGKVYASNLTPANLKEWTDGEIFRAITAGIDKDGNGLAPMMPYAIYKNLPRSDVYAIIAYLRSLPSVENTIPEPEIAFPFSLIFKTVPAPYVEVEEPDTTDLVNYGKFLSQVSGCHFCHTPIEMGEPVEGMDFAGGHEFPIPGGGIVRSTNLTQDTETGVGLWSEAMFVARFKAFANPEVQPVKINSGEFTTRMPWFELSGMKDRDLKAIFAYLKTVAPIRNSIEKFSP
mgnify:CR=1 FL=1